MTVFQLIKLVLDDEYNAITPNPTRKAVVDREITKLQAAFGDLTDPKRAPPDYSTPEARFAYVYKYTTCHASIVAAKVAAVKEVRDLFNRDGWVRMAALGGGPGSDFLGVVKHMMKKDRDASLKCYLLDVEEGWGDSWSDVEQKTTDLDFQVSTHAQALDVTEPASWTKQTKYLSSDLFTFVYFVSEVYRHQAAAQPFFQKVFADAPSGSLFLFIDNNASKFHGWFESMATNAGLVKIDGGEEWFQIDWGEEKTDLEPYYSEFDHDPKLSTNIAWRVYKKP